LDGDFLGEYDQADHYVANYEMGGGGAAGDGIGFTLTTSNVQKMFSTVQKKLARANVFKDLFFVITPDVQDVLLQYLAGKESALGDSTGLNGHVGKYYGFDLYLSNATGWSAVLAAATLMTDTDTIVINGVTFTADADGAAVGAGHFSIQGSATLCNAQLAEAINNTQAYAASVGAVDTYIEVTAANRTLMHGIVATSDATTVTLKGEGVGYIAVSETLTTTSNTWTAATQIQHCLAGKKGAVDMVIQKRPNVEVKDIYNDLGKNVVAWTLYGLKTFDDGDAELVDCKIRSDAY
jgi:hypothetical protein